MNRPSLVLTFTTTTILITSCFGHAQIRKCCQLEEILDIGNNSCVKGPTGNQWSIPTDYIHSSKRRNLTMLFNRFGRPKCNNMTHKLVQRKLSRDDIHFLSQESVAFLERPGFDHFNASRVVVGNSEFCVDSFISNSVEYLVELCLPKCSEENPCVRKCCDPHQIVDLDIFACDDIRGAEFVPGNRNIWEPFIDPEVDNVVITDATGGTTTTTTEFFYYPFPLHVKKLGVTHIGEPACKGGNLLDTEFGEKEIYKRISLLENASLLMQFNSGEKVLYRWDEFCIDGTMANRSDEENYLKNRIVFVCVGEQESQNFVDVLQEYRQHLYPILTGTSAMFLLLTSIIYSMLWKDLNLPGWLQFSYTNCLLVAFTLLTVVQIWTEQILSYSEYLCKVVGYTLHASFLSCFFWLTSMNIDLWLSFRNTSLQTNFGKSRGKKRYFGFALICISTPIGVTVAAIITDIEIKMGSNRNVELFTGIGETGCALNIQNRIVHLCYFYGVVGILLVINVMFFFCTVLCLRERQKETKFAHRQCTAPDSADLIRFRLFTRLFFVMGILWVFELISWMSTFLNLNARFLTVFVVTDCLNALQGVAIFFMFVWKPQTWRQLKKKWRKVLQMESQASLMPNTVKTTSVKSSTKSRSSSCKASGGPTSPTSPTG